MAAAVIGWMALGMALYQWCVWLINRWYEHRGPGPSAGSSAEPPGLHVLIPARCERHTLPRLLDDLRQQTLLPASVTVADDGSTDGTTEWLQSVCPEGISAPPEGLALQWFRVEGDPEPQQNGKSRTCDLLAEHRLGQEGSGWLVFIDADVRLAPDALARIQRLLAVSDIRLLSVIPALPSGILDGLLVAGVPYSVLSFLPLPLCAHSVWPSTAFANGQLMAFRASDYATWRPHRQAGQAVLDDVAIARWIKRQASAEPAFGPLRWLPAPVMWLAFAPDWMAVRMYRNGRDAVNGFTKNAAEIGGPAGVLATLVYTAAACVWPVSRFGQDWTCTAAVLLQLLLTCSIIRCFRMPLVLGLLWPVMLVAWCGVMIRSWVLRSRGGVPWRGRLVGGA